MSNLVAGIKSLKGDGLSIRYEDLLTEQAEWDRLYTFLELSCDENIMNRFVEDQLVGSMGDPTGVKLYDKISTDPLDKWKITLGNPIRKYWCKRYLKWVGKERLKLMGYDYDNLKQEINAIPFSLRYFFSDLVLVPFGFVYCFFEPYIFKKKMKNIFKWRSIYVHR